MKLHGSALRLMIFIGDTDLWHRRPLYHEMVHRPTKRAWPARA